MARNPFQWKQFRLYYLNPNGGLPETREHSTFNRAKATLR